MSSSSFRKVNEGAQQAQGEVHQPRWLEDFLGQKFSDSCPSHSKERNIYCINCKLSACKHCMSSGSHEDHRILRIYRNNYRDGVCLAAMQTYIDCSQIQSFKCNNLRVLNCHLRCGSTLDDATSCNNGSRKSKEAKAYQYCSITCMVKAARKSSIPPTVSIQAPRQESLGEICKPSKRKRKRKGTPHRAPLF